nr:UrcA family protein [uncultured Sphingomonas sp.]
MLKLSIFLFLLVGAPTISPAQSVHQEAHVKVADLDLSKASDRSRLDQRIVEACGEASSTDLAGRNQIRACRATANQQIQLLNQRLAKVESVSSSGQQ